MQADRFFVQNGLGGDKGSIRDILIIRSTNIEHLGLVLDKVRSSFQGARITILTHPHAMMGISKMGDLSIIPYRHKGDFSIFFFKEFKALKTDLIILPFNNRSGAGYINAIIFAFGIKARYRVSCNKDGEFNPMGYLYLLKKVMQGVVASMFGIIGVVVSIVPISLMVLLYGVRSCGSNKGKERNKCPDYICW